MKNNRAEKIIKASGMLAEGDSSTTRAGVLLKMMKNCSHLNSETKTDDTDLDEEEKNTDEIEFTEIKTNNSFKLVANYLGFWNTEVSISLEEQVNAEKKYTIRIMSTVTPTNSSWKKEAPKVNFVYTEASSHAIAVDLFEELQNELISLRKNYWTSKNNFYLAVEKWISYLKDQQEEYSFLFGDIIRKNYPNKFLNVYTHKENTEDNIDFMKEYLPSVLERVLEEQNKTENL